MESKIVDAVVIALNSQGFNFTCAKRYDISSEDPTSTLAVSVVPRRLNGIERRSRLGGALAEIGVAVVFRQRITNAPGSDAAIEATMNVVEQVKQYLLDDASTMNGAQCQGVEHDPYFDEELLGEHHILNCEPVFTYLTGV